MTGYDPQRTRRRPTTTRGNAAAVDALLGDADAGTPGRGMTTKPAPPALDAASETIRTPSPEPRPEADPSARGGCLGALIGLGRR